MITNPPVVQLLLTVQIQPAASSLSILDWADLRTHFSAEFPVFSQVPRAGPMPAHIDGTAVPFAPFPEVGLPRCSLASADLSQIILFQDDRISVGWQRTSSLLEQPDYPGFKNTLARAIKTIEKFLEFIDSRAAERVQIRTGELSYLNAFVMNVQGGGFRSLEDVFTCVRSNPDFRFHILNLQFQQILSIENGAPLEGVTFTTISGIHTTPHGQGSVNMQTVVRFDLAEDSLDAVMKKYDLAHGVAQDIFATLVKPEAYAISDAL